MSSFQDILNMPVSDFKEPPPFPPGTYKAMMLKHEFIKARTTDTQGVGLTCRLIQPMADVDASKLPEGWGDREMTIRFYITQDSAWRWREFLEKHLRLNIQGRTTAQVLAELPGKTCLVVVKQEVSKKNGQPDPSGRMVSFIDGTLAEPAS